MSEFTVSAISPWHVVAEVIKLSTIPSPLNPFEIDLEHFSYLAPGAAVYATAAMIHMLSQIISPSPEKLMYASKGRYIALTQKYSRITLRENTPRLIDSLFLVMI